MSVLCIEIRPILNTRRIIGLKITFFVSFRNSFCNKYLFFKAINNAITLLSARCTGTLYGVNRYTTPLQKCKCKFKFYYIYLGILISSNMITVSIFLLIICKFKNCPCAQIITNYTMKTYGGVDI
jgi:hypothetical protein